MNGRFAYFHEDDSCQIEVVPAQNRECCVAELRQAADFAERHRTPNGIGWTGIHLRGELQAPLSGLSLEVDCVAGLLSATLQPFDRVETGYSSHREACSNTRAFGFDADCVVYVARNDAGIVEHIWLGLGGPEQHAQNALLAALESLGRLRSLMLVDWGWSRLLMLDDVAAIADYLSEREAHFRQLNEEIERRSPIVDEERKAPWWKFWA